jgi:uncharacterized membrane protein YgcG
MKSLFCCVAILLYAAAAWGQGNAIMGRVVDGESQAPLIGAHLMLLQLPDSVTQATTTNVDGRFVFRDLRSGSYELSISYLGYETKVRAIEVTSGPLRLGDIALAEGAVNLEQVQVTGRVPPATQRGDTLQFNADAYKVNPDASAEDLLRKMPGVTVEGGQVQAQGEQVQRVLVDGKPFFGDDPMAALRNLPAEVIAQIQVFDQASDQAQFSGFNDGETTRGINIITRPGMNTGQFGKIFAGYGDEERYQAGGIVNVFKGDTRLSIIGQTNNINQQNFASEDLVGVTGAQSSGGRGRMGGGSGRGGGRPGGGGTSASDFLVPQQDGIATTHALGINYSDKWGKKAEVSGSYFFNFSDNDARNDIFRDFVSTSDFGQTYSEESISNRQNINHRFNFRLEYTIDSSNSIILQPRFSLQQNDGREETLGLSVLGAFPQSSTDYLFQPELSGLDFSNMLLWRHRFAKAGRTFSVNLNTGYNRNSGERFLRSINTIFTDLMLADSLDQRAELLTNGWSATANTIYTEPLGEKSQLQFNYQYSYQQSDSEQETYDFVANGQGYDAFNPLLSNIFDNEYVAQRAGAGLRRSGEKGTFNFRMTLEWADLRSTQAFPLDAQVNRSFFNVLPSLFYRYRFSRQEQLRFFYRPSTAPPSISQLQEVVNNSNPLFLRAGNPLLEQSYQHRLMAHYSKTNLEKSSVLFVMLSGQLTEDYVGNSTFIARRDTLVAQGILLPQGGQYIQPINLDGYWNVRGMVTYGQPVAWLKSNLNANFSADYVRQPGLINGALNYARNTRLGGGLTLASNISPRVDFIASSQSNYTFVENTLNTALDNNFFNQSSRLGFNLIIGKGFVFNTELNHQLFRGLSDAFNQDFFLWNMGLGKKFFGKQQGELRLTAFDLLGQNTSIRRSVTDAFVEDLQTIVLQRYFMLTFTYNIRNFGGKG